MADLSDSTVFGDLTVTRDVKVKGDMQFNDGSTAVRSNDVTRIVKVTEANYPASPEPDVLYIIVE